MLTEVYCRSVLQRSGVPGGDYAINPYSGCAFGCSFCYVRALRRRRGQEWADWGEWAEAKINAPALLRREMGRISPDARILIGTATDAWQPVEKRAGITRAILEALAECPNPVSVITRSPLVIRDIPVLKKLQSYGGVHVNFSISTFDDAARSVFEPRAPRVAGREHAIRRLIDAGIPVTLFWAPILPGVSDSAPAVSEYLSRAAELGVRRIMAGFLNYRETMDGRYSALLKAYYEKVPEARERPGRATMGRAALQREIEARAHECGISLLGGESSRDP